MAVMYPSPRVVEKPITRPVRENIVQLLDTMRDLGATDAQLERMRRLLSGDPAVRTPAEQTG